MIQNRDYSSLDQLLNIEPLTPLHLYIFLLAWTHVRTINDAIVLHDLIKPFENKSPLLTKCLELFKSHYEFITWLHNVRKYVEDLFFYIHIDFFYLLILLELICKLFFG